jgi:gamma-glutamylcysteine synthetase
MSIIDDNLPTGLMPMTQQEEKELRRVFEYLVDYESKKSIKKNITDQQKSIHAPVPILTENISSNDKALVEFNTTTEKKISADSIFEILRELGQKTSRKAVEEMIWECDEDLDECLNWHEFKLMFSRNITDHTGLEPSRMVRDFICILLL